MFVIWNDTSVIPLSEDLLLFCILCAKNLGSSKWALKTIPRMSDTDKDMIPSFCIIVCYLTIMQVYIFHQSHYIRGKNSKLLYNIPVRVIYTCTCFHDNVQVCFLCCFLCLFVLFCLCSILISCLFLCSLLSFLNSNRNLDSVFTNISKTGFFLLSNVFF